MRHFLIALTRNPISLFGAAITTSTAVLIVALLAIEWMGSRGNPYTGILAYLFLPALFLLGLLLIPVGVFRERRRTQRRLERGGAEPAFPVIDLNHGKTRRFALTFLLLSLANLVIVATATYKGVEVMESTEFCGRACHSVMHPEHTAYEGSPHARVKCVECHIGPGADWFVKSKLSGAWQVVSVVFDLYPRPIPAPIENLRPARETCEQCHWPTKFHGDKLEVITRYADDEPSTELKTVLLLRVGGRKEGRSQGIHWHVDPANRIRYRSDPSRETIHDVELTLADGTTRLFRNPSSEPAPEEEVESEWRVMDCVDCHNRPTHVYRMPDEAVDLAILDGKLDRGLPFIKRESARVLQQAYASHELARRGIATDLRAFYEENHPDLSASDRGAVDRAGQVLGDIYASNVFPEMRVDWGTYADHIGHERFPGCFRCHDDEHVADDGEAISQDCFTCHTLLAMEEEDPEVLETLQP